MERLVERKFWLLAVLLAGIGAIRAGHWMFAEATCYKLQSTLLYSLTAASVIFMLLYAYFTENDSFRSKLQTLGFVLVVGLFVPAVSGPFLTRVPFVQAQYCPDVADRKVAEAKELRKAGKLDAAEFLLRQSLEIASSEQSKATVELELARTLCEKAGELIREQRCREIEPVLYEADTLANKQGSDDLMRAIEARRQDFQHVCATPTPTFTPTRTPMPTSTFTVTPTPTSTPTFTPTPTPTPTPTFTSTPTPTPTSTPTPTFTPTPTATPTPTFTPTRTPTPTPTPPGPCDPPTRPAGRIDLIVNKTEESDSISVPRVFAKARIKLSLEGNEIICLASSRDGRGSLRVDDQIEFQVIHADGTKETWVRNFFDPDTRGIKPFPSQDVSWMFKPGDNEIVVTVSDLHYPKYSADPVWLIIWTP